MDKKKYKNRLYYILLAPLGFLISYYSSFNSEFIENYYSRGFFKVISQFLNLITGIFPISLAEITVISIVLFTLISLIRITIMVIKKKPEGIITLRKFTVNIAVFFSTLYFLFVILWGLNYHRLSLANSLKLNVKPSSIDELANLCESLTARANLLREILPEDSSGIMKLSKPLSEVFKDLNSSYISASANLPFLSGKYGRAKGVMLSRVMPYTGITGFYFPFSGEANVNTVIPDLDIPSTAAHEMAHQRGFAREDEANYVSYLVCTLQPNPQYQYSGVMLALIHSMNALYSSDINRYKQIRSKYSDKVLGDLKRLSDFWKKYEGPVDKLSSSINDAYLKSNLQEQGIKSYGRMVDLLLAEQRKFKEK